MKTELERQLIQQFPEMFQGVKKPLRESLMGFGCECGDGWYGLIEQVCLDIKYLKTPIEWTQIKEKFGGLRMYFRFLGYPKQAEVDEVYKVIDRAEEQSFKICEQCGEVGKRQTDHYWVRTECDACRERRVHVSPKDASE